MRVLLEARPVPVQGPVQRVQHRGSSGWRMIVALMLAGFVAYIGIATFSVFKYVKEMRS